MDLLSEFEARSHDFWLAWCRLPEAEKRRLTSTHQFHQVFKTSFSIKQALQKQLMTGPPHCQTYSAASLPEHAIQCSDSDSELGLDA